MLFNSFAFLLFFPVVTLLYFLLPHSYRWLMLLVASCIFYMFYKPAYIFILAFTIIVDYWAGISISKAPLPNQKKQYLLLSIGANLGMLAAFKYFNFFSVNLSIFTALLGYKNPIPFLEMALPVGLSFHTFQAMSYTIEVYKGNQKAEKHFGIFALYVMFYPQLVAGPIERPQQILHQFKEQKVFVYADVVAGLRLMLWGMFKKVVIADRLAVVTDAVFNAPSAFSSASVVVGVFFFSFQIYCDFSGYSDIAIGAARVMGYRLSLNFAQPYGARSLTEFWRRWHISLSTWFRDYVYIPLGGGRKGKLLKLRNVLLVFMASGLWHGADWKFLLWGALHGGLVAIEEVTIPLKDHVNKLLQNKWLPIRRALLGWITFLLVCLLWVFFRANSTTDAIYILKRLPAAIGELHLAITQQHKLFNLSLSPYRLGLCFVVIAVLLWVDYVLANKSATHRFTTMHSALRWGVYYFAVLCILLLGVFGNREFIYFQF